MSTVMEFIDVNVPVSRAYNQWTQFETFPQFMEGVERIDQLTETTNHWVTSIAGVKREFDTEITEQHTDLRIAWRAIGGQDHAGVVTFHRLGESTTRVTVQMDYEAHGLVETLGDKLGFVDRRVKGDLERFKQFIESHGSETGAWRGEVEPPPTAG